MKLETNDVSHLEWMSKEADKENKYEKPWENGSLRVTGNGRYFCCGDTPFFWMGDTAWLLFHQLTSREAYCYLRGRKELGYNVILADFLHTPEQVNLAGESALEEGDFSRIKKDGGFWEHVDQVLKMAEELGLYMGLLPVWGSSIVAGGSLNDGNLDGYLDFILDRYHDAPNLIWIVGGDVRGDVNPGLFCRIGRRMKEDRPDRLVGYHPFGRTSSSLWFHEEDWLDFNLFQSGHRRYDQTELGAWDDNSEKEGCFGEDCWRYVKRDYEKLPVKPVLDGEPSYEWVVQGLHDLTQPYWKAADVRRYAYWDVFAGAAGHTYGHNSIMQFYRDLSQKGAFGAKYLWSDAIHHPGGAQMIHLKRLMESVDYGNGRPAQELLLMEEGLKYDYVSVFAGENFLFAYTCTGRAIRLSLTNFKGKIKSAYWMDPVTGMQTFICEVTGKEEAVFLPPEREDGSDSVLVIR